MSGLLLTLTPTLGAVLAGVSLFTLGVFAGQAATSEYVSRRAGSRRSQALGLYLSCYYLADAPAAPCRDFAGVWAAGAPVCSCWCARNCFNCAYPGACNS